MNKNILSYLFAINIYYMPSIYIFIQLGLYVENLKHMSIQQAQCAFLHALLYIQLTMHLYMAKENVYQSGHKTILF